MNTDEPDDLPSALTSLLRGVPGVHTVYATQAPIPTVVTAVVEAVKNEPVGVHLVTVTEKNDQLAVEACIGVFGDEPAVQIARRAYEAIDAFLTESHETSDRMVTVRVGRVG